MKVKCIYNTGIAYKDIEMPPGYFITSEFNLEIGKEYPVMGIVLWRKTLLYLTDDNNKPSWYPYQLFTISEPSLDPKWFFKTFTKGESEFVEALWGYQELCMVDGYYEALLERDNDAIKTYFARRLEMA